MRFLRGWAAITLAAQGCLLHAAAPIAVNQARYELRAGTPATLDAPQDTLDFLLHAKSLRVDSASGPGPRFVAAPNRARTEIRIAAPLKTPAGQYAVQLTGTSASGEERTASLSVIVHPLQTVAHDSTRPPVVLLNGWEGGYSGTCTLTTSVETFGNLQAYLESDGVPAVYYFDNCAEDTPDQLIEVLGNDLAKFLSNLVTSSADTVTQFDLVAHSMGGLIARSYLDGLQSDGTLIPPATTFVRKLVLIAVPDFGSFLAGNSSNLLPTGTQNAELVPASALLWNLATWNQRSDDLRGVDAIAIIGNAGNWTASLEATTAQTNASDGVVSLTSAALGFATSDSTRTRIVPYCHVDPAVFTNVTYGAMQCDAAGIANVTDTSQYTGQIVRSFLADTDDWQSIGGTPPDDPYLSIDGGMYFSLVDATGSLVADVSEVAWGTLTFTNGGVLNAYYYDDFINGTGDFHVTSSSLGTVDCGSFAEPLGYFTTARCKIGTLIDSIGPLNTGTAKTISPGAALTITGIDFATNCGQCKVTATPLNTGTEYTLSVSSWTDTQITATLPANLTGMISIVVVAVPGSDAMNIMVVSPNAAGTIAAAPTSLTFTYSVGGTAPAAQSIAISNSGSGTLDWTATASATWLAVSPASGTAPSNLSVSVDTTGLNAGNYTGNIQISSTGATNTPLTLAVTLTVSAAAAALAVTPVSLNFTYSIGASVPAAQNVSITNTGGGALAWTATSSAAWIILSAASGSVPSTLGVSVEPRNMASGTYTGSVQITAAGASGSPATVAVSLVVSGTAPAGVITSVTSAASYQTSFASGSWVAIFGTNLSQITRVWQASDFVGGNLPVSLSGVSVTIDGIPAYVEYISPTQINVLAPDDSNVGSVGVAVTTAGVASNTFNAGKQQFVPAFFIVSGSTDAAALHLDGSLVSQASPAKPNEIIEIYGTGFGPTNPVLPSSKEVTVPEALANTVTMTIGAQTAVVGYAGVVESGLTQINVTIPANAPAGNAAIVAQVGGQQTQSGVTIAVGQ